MLQEEPPPLPEWRWLRKVFDPWRSWLKKKQVFPADDSIIADERPGGTALRVADRIAGDAVRPLTIIADNGDSGPRWRVVKGGWYVGGIFWYADSAMDHTEDGSIEHPFFYVSGLSHGHKIYGDITLSFDGVFWRGDASEIGHGATVPAPTATRYCPLIGVVTLTAAGVAGVAQPQEFFGNIGTRRSGIVSGLVDEPYGFPR